MVVLVVVLVLVLVVVVVVVVHAMAERVRSEATRCMYVERRFSSSMAFSSTTSLGEK